MSASARLKVAAAADGAGGRFAGERVEAQRVPYRDDLVEREGLVRVGPQSAALRMLAEHEAEELRAGLDVLQVGDQLRFLRVVVGGERYGVASEWVGVDGGDAGEAALARRQVGAPQVGAGKGQVRLVGDDLALAGWEELDEQGFVPVAHAVLGEHAEHAALHPAAPERRSGVRADLLPGAVGHAHRAAHADSFV